MGRILWMKLEKEDMSEEQQGILEKNDTGFYNIVGCFIYLDSCYTCVLTEVLLTTAANVLFSPRHPAQCERFVSLYHNLVEIRGCCYCTWCQSDCFYWEFTLFILFPLSAQSSSRERPGHCYVSRGHLSVLADSSQRCSEWQPAGFQGHLLGQPAWWRYTFISVHDLKTWTLHVPMKLNMYIVFMT